MSNLRHFQVKQIAQTTSDLTLSHVYWQGSFKIISGV